ncbi:Uncharacterized protein APZ42_034025 [Daphnia magna]|uniref:Uncharacterized protein n=1 Tax=Daphnia magna TaxID=35525 RepID=A0A164KIP7_9CRUS|nr:Uncharacterized protein APZ42_034025 [Daphnia magna]
MTSYTIFNRAENYSELKKKDIKEIKVIRVFIQNKFVIGKPVGAFSNILVGAAVMASWRAGALGNCNFYIASCPGRYLLCFIQPDSLMNLTEAQLGSSVAGHL